MSFTAVKKYEWQNVFVYVATFDESANIEDVLPAERNDYIRAAKDDLLRRQRYWVWKLLRLALCEQFGDVELDLAQADGKWFDRSGKAHFSLSHSGNAVAVAVASFPVGVDVQSLSFGNFGGLAKRICTPKELARFDSLPQNERQGYLAELWSLKESIFKLSGNGVFLPSSIDVTCRDAFCKKLRFGKEEFVLTSAK